MTNVRLYHRVVGYISVQKEKKDHGVSCGTGRWLDDGWLGWLFAYCTFSPFVLLLCEEGFCVSFWFRRCTTCVDCFLFSLCTHAHNRCRVTDVPRVRLELGRNLEGDHIREGIDVYFDCHVTARPSAFRLVWRHQVRLFSLDKTAEWWILISPCPVPSVCIVYYIMRFRS